MKKIDSAPEVLRADYEAYGWRLERAALRFEIGEVTRVFSTLDFKPAKGAEPARCIELNGDNLKLVLVRVDGRQLVEGDYRFEDETLSIDVEGGPCRIETEVEINPDENTALEGLYRSGEFLLTQCEPEGFRKITFFPDRPDVMTVFDVTIVADKSRYPVLLSNGNAVEAGDLDDGRHWVRWLDPFAKPSYLFALVAGDLECIEGRFLTGSGRDVALRFYVEKENAGLCDHALESLVRAMKWDEDRFGLEYDLDVYHIVATNDFNMGAMENKSLNIFNSKYVLASPQTATDADFQGIESVIGHEYFHNWTGNRVTCRDWFQLTLKEGLTVFRDQEFTSDLQSRAVKRINDVRVLRGHQFAEDSGPMAHPIRPDKYKEINNFYTMTVYQKGAEIIRMYHTLLGEEAFQNGMRLYFERHDGEAVTCDDFLAAMADANDVTLDRFSRWYGQSGTPVLHVSALYDESGRTFTLTIRQHTPPTAGQEEKKALLIPVLTGLLGRDGRQLPLHPAGDVRVRDGSALLILRESEASYVFNDVDEEPVPSLLRGFSAPVKLEYEYEDCELALLLAHDSDAFVRWEAGQVLGRRAIMDNLERYRNDREMVLCETLIGAFESLLAYDRDDPAFVAEALGLPEETYLAELVDEVDVDGIHAARQFLRAGIANRLQDQFHARYVSLAQEGAFRKDAAAMAARRLRNTCLSYLMETPLGQELADRQLAESDNMTDTLAAMAGLVHKRAVSAAGALDAFLERWRNDALVMDKWFSVQASAPGPETVGAVRRLLNHELFNIRNPNKVRSLLGVFSGLNPTAFHAADGSGYQLLAEQVMELDALNPQTAARLVSAFNAWTRYDRERKEHMRAALMRISSRPGLSSDVSEIVGNALAMGSPDGSK